MSSSTVTTLVNVNSTPAAYIMSHSTFNFGQKLSQFNRTHQALFFRELTNSTIFKIEFLYIDIGCTSNYNNDTAYIQSLVGGAEPPFSFTCYNLTSDITVSPATTERNSESSNATILVLSSYVGFSFKISNDEKRGGFLLKYSGQ